MHTQIKKGMIWIMNEWINNPMLKNIDPVKLNLIQKAASQVSGKSGKDLAPIMMALITSANRQKIQFTQEEITLILEILKEGKSKEEQEQIDKSIQMVTTLIKMNQK